jgi:hypothetical protein
MTSPDPYDEDVQQILKTIERLTYYIYRWNRQGKKGRRCKVTARGTMNSCRVEFEDGYVMITSRNALKREASRE